MKLLYWLKVILALPVAILFGAAAVVVCLLAIVGSALYVAFRGPDPGEYGLHDRDNLE